MIFKSFKKGKDTTSWENENYKPIKTSSYDCEYRKEQMPLSSFDVTCKKDQQPKSNKPYICINQTWIIQMCW